MGFFDNMLAKQIATNVAYYFYRIMDKYGTKLKNNDLAALFLSGLSNGLPLIQDSVISIDSILSLVRGVKDSNDRDGIEKAMYEFIINYKSLISPKHGNMSDMLFPPEKDTIVKTINKIKDKARSSIFKDKKRNDAVDYVMGIRDWEAFFEENSDIFE